MASEIEEEGDGPGRGGAAAAALHGSTGVVGHGAQQPGQGGMFGPPLSEPYVLVVCAHPCPAATARRTSLPGLLVASAGAWLTGVMDARGG